MPRVVDYVSLHTLHIYVLTLQQTLTLAQTQVGYAQEVNVPQQTLLTEAVEMKANLLVRRTCGYRHTEVRL